MLNRIWPIFILISIIVSICTGRIVEINTTILNSAKDSIDLIIVLTGSMCLWNGIMKIAIETKIVDKLSSLLKPLIFKLIPEAKKSSELHKAISVNIIANMLGLGNAATPFGIKAIKKLKEFTQDGGLSNSMIMLIVINTASIQIIPTTILSIRTSLGSENPAKIMIPVWISTVCALCVGIMSVKLICRKKGR